MASVRGVTATASDGGPYRSTIAVPAEAVAKDVFAVCHIVDNDISATSAMSALESGWTRVTEYGPQYEPRLVLWTRELAQGDLGAVYTFQHNTASGGRSSALVGLACADVDAANPLDAGPTTGYVSPSGSSGAKTTMALGSLSPSAAGALSLAFGSATRYATADAGGQFYTPPSGWTERYDVGQAWLKPVVYTRDNVPGATGAVDAAISGGGAGAGYSGMHVLLRHKAAAPSGPEPGRPMLAT